MPADRPYPNETTEAFRKRAAKTTRLKRNPFKSTIQHTAPFKSKIKRSK